MNQDIQRHLKSGYNCPIWKKQDNATWSTLQKSICTDCASKIPNSFIVMSDAMAIDINHNVSAEAKTNEIIDWIEWNDTIKHFESIYRKKVKCSECGKSIKGEVNFNGF